MLIVTCGQKTNPENEKNTCSNNCEKRTPRTTFGNCINDGLFIVVNQNERVSENLKIVPHINVIQNLNKVTSIFRNNVIVPVLIQCGIQKKNARLKNPRTKSIQTIFHSDNV